MESTLKTTAKPQQDYPIIWAEAKKQYKLLNRVGEGTFGTVVKARNRTTNQIVAIKLINNISSSTQAKSILRELVILRKLTSIQNNLFSSEIIDVILPPNVFTNKYMNIQEQQSSPSQSQKTKDSDDTFIHINGKKFDHIFIVMEFVESDLRQMLSKSKKIEYDDDHVITILYNILCAVNLIHSANVIHRDLKPANILIDDNCGVKICDFGLSRTMPAKSDQERSIQKFIKSHQKQVDESPEKRESREIKFKAQTAELLTKQQQERKSEVRQLSSCIQTRWYRAPEVILLDHNYNKAIDIFSVGLILSELLLCTKKYSSKPNFNASDRYLFKGDSCYPISPMKDSGDEVGQNDQIFKILKQLPEINDQDYSHLTTDESIHYIENLKMSQENGTIFDLLKEANPELVSILKQMLEFNPYFRPSAQHLLKNKIFDSVRIKGNEVQATKKIVISVDKHAGIAIAQSQSELQDLNNDEPAKIQKLKQMIILEALKLKKENSYQI